MPARVSGQRYRHEAIEVVADQDSRPPNVLGRARREGRNAFALEENRGRDRPGQRALSPVAVAVAVGKRKIHCAVARKPSWMPPMGLS